MGLNWSQMFGVGNSYGGQPVDLSRNQANYSKAIEDTMSRGVGAWGMQLGAYNQAQDYLNTLQQQATGQAQSPFMRQMTNQNIAQQASLLGSQKGINTGMGARLIGQQGGNLQQQSIAQGQALSQQAYGQALANQQSAALGMGQGQAQLANIYGGLQNAQNTAQIQNQLGAQQITAAAAAQNAAFNQNITGGFLSGLGSALAGGGSSGGGSGGGGGGGMTSMIGGMFADGGEVGLGVDTSLGIQEQPKVNSPLGVDTNLTIPTTSNPIASEGTYYPGSSDVDKYTTPVQKTIANSSQYGQGNAVYEGARSVPMGVAEGIKKIFMFADEGGSVDGQAKVDGDSLKNDTVPAMLSPGEIVLPRSVTQSPDAAKKAKSFVEAIQKSHNPKEKIEYKHVLEHHKNMMKWMGGAA